ncbi:MAG: ATP synthase F1 subunit gamma [Lachnospiraceae bacterium]
MAGGKSRELKNRMKGVGNTQKIVKAMGLVASSKLGRANDQIQRSRPYFQMLYSTLVEAAESSVDFESLYLKKIREGPACVIVLGGDRGLAGGYNSNVFRAVKRIAEEESVIIIPIGKKSFEYYKKRDSSLWSTQQMLLSEMSISSCFELGKMICDAYLNGTISKIYMVYTNFRSRIEQVVDTMPILPLEDIIRKKDIKKKNVLFEPDEETVFNAIVPEYVAGLLYGGVCEALASELAARSAAMDAAGKNADEILEKLEIQFNRERQGSITQEITEIVAGSGGNI